MLGAGRLLGISIDGPWAVLPWLLPTIVGMPAGMIWVRYYRRKSGSRLHPSGSTPPIRRPRRAGIRPAPQS